MPVLMGLMFLLTARPVAADERQALALVFDEHDYSTFGNYELSAFPGSTMPLVEQAMSGGGYEVRVHANPPKPPLVIEMYRLDNPPITQSHYAIVGTVGYQEVSAPAYLELWSEFADGSRYFSRTLADSGPLMNIEGSSAQRDFRLPFEARPGLTPKRLTLNLVMAGRGTVTIEKASLVEESLPTPSTQPALARRATTGPAAGARSLADLPPDMQMAVRKEMAAQIGPLMQARTAAEADLAESEKSLSSQHPALIKKREAVESLNQRIATLLASLREPVPDEAVSPVPATSSPLTGLAWLDRHFATVFLTLIVLCVASIVPLRWLIRHGRGRGVVLGFFGLMLAIGLAELFAAGIAMGLGRPASAWATLLGCATIAIVIPALQLPQIRRQYADLELRKMRAMDVG